MEKLFGLWLSENCDLSENSIGKYQRAIRAVTKDMMEEGILDKDLYAITSSSEFDSIRTDIYNNRYFDEKDTRGNRMYSVALNHYMTFLEARQQ